MHVRGGHLPGADKLVLHIDRDVVLAAEMTLFTLLRPAGVHILLPAFGLAPVCGRIARLDRLVFLPAVPLPGRGHDARINNLAL